jgi:O-acetyl-ADP-ribose deacetylase (regulator of RNase III)
MDHPPTEAPREQAEKKVGASRIVLKVGDITREAADAIVNAANSSLLGGGGVDGAIHRAGGPEILAECREIRARQGGCPTGEAVVTTAGKLPAGCVIHTVGPRWAGGDRAEEALLRSAYRNSLRRARERRAGTVAFPSISTGAYGYPIQLAARAALDEVARELRSAAAPLEVRFVLFQSADFEVYRQALESTEV